MVIKNNRLPKKLRDDFKRLPIRLRSKVIIITKRLLELQKENNNLLRNELISDEKNNGGKK